MQWKVRPHAESGLSIVVTSPLPRSPLPLTSASRSQCRPCKPAANLSVTTRTVTFHHSTDKKPYAHRWKLTRSPGTTLLMPFRTPAREAGMLCYHGFHLTTVCSRRGIQPITQGSTGLNGPDRTRVHHTTLEYGTINRRTALRPGCACLCIA